MFNNDDDYEAIYNKQWYSDWKDADVPNIDQNVDHRN